MQLVITTKSAHRPSSKDVRQHEKEMGIMPSQQSQKLLTDSTHADFRAANFEIEPAGELKEAVELLACQDRIRAAIPKRITGLELPKGLIPRTMKVRARQV